MKKGNIKSKIILWHCNILCLYNFSQEKGYLICSLWHHGSGYSRHRPRPGAAGVKNLTSVGNWYIVSPVLAVVREQRHPRIRRIQRTNPHPHSREMSVSNPHSSKKDFWCFVEAWTVRCKAKNGCFTLTPWSLRKEMNISGVFSQKTDYTIWCRVQRCVMVPATESAPNWHCSRKGKWYICWTSWVNKAWFLRKKFMSYCLFLSSHNKETKVITHSSFV